MRILTLGLVAFLSEVTFGQPISTIDLQNPTNSAITAHEVTYGHAFLQGQVSNGTGLTISAANATIPAQLDVKTRYADSSARLGIISFKAPALAANQTLSAEVRTTNAPRGTEVDIAGLPDSGWTFSVVVAISGGTTYTVQADQLLAQQLANKKASYWLRGPEVTEARVDTFLTGSLHVAFDIRNHVDGSVLTDVQFNNDRALTTSGGRLTYNVIITQNGRPVFERNAVAHYQYQTWHKQFWSTSAPIVNVKRDIFTMRRSGAVQPFNLSYSIDPDMVSSMTSAVARTNWDTPLAANDLEQYMPTTGARPDIGPTTQANAVWLISQSQSAEKYALGQANSAGAVPWHFWDPATGMYVSALQYPQLWVDERGGNGLPGGLTQQIPTDCGWTPDGAHQPDLSYIPYILTGTRYYLDQLNAQADYSILCIWPEYRNIDSYAGIVANASDQERQQAWSLRQVHEAAFANPDGSPMKTYFAKVESDNWAWLLSKINGWTTAQGEPHGYIPGYDINDVGILAPWMQDYFASTVVSAALRGNTSAVTYLDWSANFLVGRFQTRAGWNPHAGAAYNLQIGNGTRLYTTWAQIGGASATSWEGGNFAELAVMTLSGIVTATKSATAAEALSWIINSKAPSLNVDPQFQWGDSTNLAVPSTTAYRHDAANAGPNAPKCFTIVNRGVSDCHKKVPFIAYDIRGRLLPAAGLNQSGNAVRVEIRILDSRQ